ncbi:MAG: hypothetical protein C4523_12845, partial [Myxococcales bacterium]
MFQHTKLRPAVSACLVALPLVFVVGCPVQPPTDGNDNGNGNVNANDNGDDAIAQITANFATSIHGARPGKATFYEADDGFFSLTGIPMSDLACTRCHAAALADGTEVDAATYVAGCGDCHVVPDDPTADPVPDNMCLGCHGRQGAEQNLFSDVHRTAGMGCTDCHTQREMHGDGTVYESFLVDGAFDAACE